jgi:Malate/L-lactate dehydrogenase
MVDAGAIAVIDGKDSMGQVLTAHAMEEPIRRSKARGIGAVGLRNSNHFVTAMYFTLMAARAGCRLSRDQCQSRDKASLLRPTRWPRSVREVYLLRILWPPEQFHRLLPTNS